MRKIKIIDPREFMSLAYERSMELMSVMDAGDAIIVRGLFEPKTLRDIRDKAYLLGQMTEPSWHPCVDGCPDYHRLHDNYPKAHVKQKMHAFYWHGFHHQNSFLFNLFRDIFNIKCHLASVPLGTYIQNQPSQGPIARINLHHYPVGGGYQAQHIDPVEKFAKIQTLILASQHGVDYRSGGLYMDPDGQGPFYLDAYTQLGDMLVISPGVRHGVAEIDPDEPYGWRLNTGRWMIMPIIIKSDVDLNATRPIEV